MWSWFLSTLAAAAPVPGVPDAMALGDCRAVLAALSGQTDRSAALGRAVCHLRGGDARSALDALAGTPDPLLGGYERLVRARAALAAGDPTLARQALDGLTLPGAAGGEVRLLRGRLLAEAGDPRARAELEGLLEGEHRDEARLLLATALAAGGDPAGERSALRRVWTDARPGGWDARAAERLSALGAPVPELGSPEGRALARERLNGLHRASRTAEAAALAAELERVEPSRTRSSRMTLGAVRYAARDYAGALAAWGQVLGAPAEAVGAADELFDYALCHARAGDYDTAAVVYRRTMAQHPDSPQADFASFKLGYMEYDRGDCGKAVPLLQDHRARYPASKHLDEAFWFEARCHWKAGDRTAAAAAWSALEKARPKSSLVPGAAYWRARATGLAGDPAGETAALKGVLSRWPTSGYAWLAAERLGRTFPAKAPAPTPPWPPSLAARPEVRRAEALLDLGLRQWASDELDPLGSPKDAASALPLAWARLRAGDYKAAQKLACPHAAPPWNDGDPVAQQACTPRPEAAQVERFAAPYGLPPALAYGVMVAESALAPGVSSPAGARGLMQLMPEVGERLHADLFPDRPYDPDDLFSAPYNAALGTTELGQRARSLAGTLSPTPVPAVVASYNGGEEAVRRWIGDASTPPPSDEWAEDIGYTETRGYVKKVLGYAMAYRWVYGDPPP